MGGEVSFTPTDLQLKLRYAFLLQFSIIDTRLGKNYLLRGCRPKTSVVQMTKFWQNLYGASLPTRHSVDLVAREVEHYPRLVFGAWSVALVVAYLSRPAFLLKEITVHEKLYIPEVLHHVAPYLPSVAPPPPRAPSLACTFLQRLRLTWGQRLRPPYMRCSRKHFPHFLSNGSMIGWENVSRSSGRQSRNVRNTSVLSAMHWSWTEATCLSSSMILFSRCLICCSKTMVSCVSWTPLTGAGEGVGECWA